MSTECIKTKNNDFIVVGAGPAGMLAAAAAGQRGLRGIVVEKMDRTCLKLGITGKGRCNLTNNCGIDTLMENVAVNPKFLYSAFTAFPPSSVMTLFESLGVPLKTERGARVFPASDRASDIVYALRDYVKSSGVTIVRDDIKSLIIENGAATGVSGEKNDYRARNVIVATGGLSYPKTGSDGAGYILAQQAGHTVTDTSASLVPLNADKTICAPLSGLALKNTAFRLLCEGTSIFEDFGELLFAHFGITGPVVLSASAHMKNSGKYEVSLDLKPAQDEKTLDARLVREFSQYPNLNFSNYSRKLLPGGLYVPICAQAGLAADTKLNAVTKENRTSLIRTLKDFRISVESKRPIEEAIVTSGGVSVKEINPKTMASKLTHGLYFAGEVIDVDAYTGGYNLQIAWSTGYAAGSSVN